MLKYSISVRKFYASWIKLFFHFLLNNKQHRVFQPLSFSFMIDTDWEEKRQNRLSFLRHSRWRSFSCDSSGIPGTRLNRFQRWSLSKCIGENGNLFPSSSRNYDSYKRNVISQFSESSYRFFTQIQNTLRHFRCFWNATRWISMTYHANDIFWRAASMSQNLEKFQNVKFFSSVMKFLIWSIGRLINGLRYERN